MIGWLFGRVWVRLSSSHLRDTVKAKNTTTKTFGKQFFGKDEMKEMVKSGKEMEVLQMQEGLFKQRKLDEKTVQVQRLFVMEAYGRLRMT